MRHRIRAAALLVDADRILLVYHEDSQTGRGFWAPPGGGLEAQDNSIHLCAIREVFEETGLGVTLSRIAYIREFCDDVTGTLHLEIFFLASSWSGNITLEHLPAGQPDSDMIKESRWVGREELKSLTVYPPELKDDFWTHHADGFPTTIYLGRTF